MADPSKPTPWARDADDVVAELDVDPSRGLSEAEATRRRAVHGANVLRVKGPRSAWLILWAQVKSVLFVLLGGALVAAAAFGEWVEAGAILSVLVVNAAIGFFTELRAARSMESLRAMGAAQVTVRRDAAVVVIPAADLVPGDVVVLEGGDVVTADLRLVESSKLQADESTLTGESLPVGKSVAPVAADAPLAERTPMLFKGTVVSRGAGVAVVVATGMMSELGRISRLVEEAEEEVTPLERRLERLGRSLIGVTLVIAALVGVAAWLGGKPLYLVIETAIALAVAAVPEGLPIIATIALARGMHRMVRHDALVNRLSAVETLGATSVICTDKTGTLTQNRIRVERYDLAEVEDAQRCAHEVGALCNNAALVPGAAAVGDPLEVALLLAAVEVELDREALLERWPEVREVAFDPAVKMMATVHGPAPDGGYRVAVKGAPEAVLDACGLDAAARDRWLERAEALAEQGLRVLALAQARRESPDGPVYEALTLLGLVAMHDPPREGVRDTVAACRRAGVRLVMVTGDHPRTARNIALAAGLVDEPDADVVLGADLENADADPAVLRRVLDTSVVARVSPEQKLDLIRLHQASGAIVAMTGDGVNDAPALRKADIGVAMGRGTAAAKEASAMILRDDDLSTIVVAIGEGRAIFDNIRKFVVYLLSCNMGEVLVVALASLAGAPLPLLPMQILFLNLVTDVFPALALGVGEGADDVLDRPPRDPAEPVITRGHWQAIVSFGGLMAASVLAAFALAHHWLELDDRGAVTVSFLSLALGQLWHVLNVRRPGGRVLVNEVTRNPWVGGAVALCVVLLLMAVYVPPLAGVLSVRPIGAAAWALAFVSSLVPVAVGQAALVVVSRRQER